VEINCYDQISEPRLLYKIYEFIRIYLHMINVHLIYEKLYEIIARKDQSTIYPNTFETHESFTCSDYCSIILSSKPQHETCIAFSFLFLELLVQLSATEYYSMKKMRILFY